MCVCPAPPGRHPKLRCPARGFSVSGDMGSVQHVDRQSAPQAVMDRCSAVGRGEALTPAGPDEPGGHGAQRGVRGTHPVYV